MSTVEAIREPVKPAQTRPINQSGGLSERFQRYGVIRTVLFLIWWRLPSKGRRIMEKFLAKRFANTQVEPKYLAINQTKIHADLSSGWTARVYYLLGRYDETDMNTIKSLVSSDFAFVDIGANFGAWTYSLADHFKTTYAVEPNPRCFAALKKTKEKGVWLQVQLVNCALSRIDGETDLYLTDQAIGDDRIYNPQSTNRQNKVTVKTLSFDSFAHSAGLSNPQVFIKMDAQGAEHWILEGMTEFLQKSQTVLIYMEIQHNLLADVNLTLKQFLNILKDRGFQPVDLSPGFPILDWSVIAERMPKNKDFCFLYQKG